ncbi:MAG TPA: sensor histidine kinase [Clostridiales bacterium]|mgnify:CR=1 FL=1|nr:sensor histidine kinase [Clostridiales bacterium]
MKKLSKLTRSTRLRDRFTLIYIFFLAIPMLFVCLYLYGQLSIISEYQGQQVVERAIRQSGASIASLVEEIENVAGQVFINTTLVKYITDEDSSDANQYSELKYIENIIDQILYYPQVGYVRMYIPSYKLYARNYAIMFPIEDIMDTENYKQLIGRERQIGWTDSYSYSIKDQGSRDVITYMVALKDFTQIARIVGCVCIDIKQSTFIEKLKVTIIGDNAVSLLLSDRGDVMASASGDYCKLDTNLIDEIILSYRGKDNVDFHELNGKYLTVKVDGKKYVAISHTIKSNGWTIVYTMPHSDILARSKKLMNTIIITVMFIITISVMSVVIVTDRITKGISRVISKMNDIDIVYHNVSPHMQIDNVSYNDEIGSLQKTFNGMISRIYQLNNEIYQTKILKREAELRALQAQINPHFLYNMLDSINWMALKAGNDAISDVVSDLGRFYRISLSGGKDIITIAEELEHVKLYIALQSKRFEDAITVNYNVDSTVMGLKMAKLTLQPLVENAIIHGIMEKPEKKGQIFINAYIESDIVKIVVTDDGVGFGLKNQNDVSINNHHGSGYGLKNVDQRIKLYFGDNYGVRLYRSSDMLTIAEISLPAIEMI